jgi:ATP-binding cassette subfamily C protein CydC
MKVKASLTTLIRKEQSRQGGPLRAAAACGALVAVSSAALLGVSGWFITGAAAAGLAGAALGFNYMLPSAGIRLFAMVRTGGRYGERLAGHKAALNALANIRSALFDGLAAAPTGVALALSTGEATARLVQDVEAAETRFIRFSSRWSAAAALSCGVVLTGLASVSAATLLIGLFAVNVAAGRVLAGRLSSGPGAKTLQAGGRLKDVYASLAAASSELFCYGLQDWAAARIAAEGRALADARQSLVAAQGSRVTLGTCLSALAASGTILLCRDAPLPLAALASLVAAVTLEGADGLVRAFEQDGALDEAARRLDPFLAAGAALDHIPRPDLSPVLRIETGLGRIDLRPGERLAIVGRSGCGKTTLLEGFMRLRPILRGRLWIGGVDVADLSDESARQMFAYAPQDPTLLSGTIRDNLRLAAPLATDAQLWSALFDAALDAKIMSLPERLDTWIGEDGQRLSGGERRRLALARAYLRGSPWLVLDEPTEGLDAATEAEVFRRLETRLRRTGQGLLVVSHRLCVLDQNLRIYQADAPTGEDLRNAA